MNLKNYIHGLKSAADIFIGAILYRPDFVLFTYFNYRGEAGGIKAYHRWNGLTKKWTPIKIQGGFIFDCKNNAWIKP